MKNMRSSAAILAGALALASSLAACGGSGTGSGTAGRPGQLDAGDRAFVTFTRCMRAHGVHMSDPYHRAGHSGLTLDIPPKTPATVRADAHCGHIIANLVAHKERYAATHAGFRATTAAHLALLHYARCMRARGIPMLDPDANGNLNLGNVPGAADVGRYTPLFHRADHACRGMLPASVADNGTGP